MKLIRTVTMVCSLILVISFSNAFAESKHIIDSANSIVTFSMITKEYAVAPAMFRNIEGSISKTGDMEVIIDLNSVETYITIRNTRVKSLFFNTEKFPQARLTARIDMQELESISHYKKMQIPATLEFYGKSNGITLRVLVARVSEDKFLFTSIKPLVIDSKDYGIPTENLQQLSRRAGGISISGVVPVNFVFSFKEAK